MSQKNLDLLVRKGLLDRKKVSVMEICEDCVYGKAKRVSFLVATHDTKDHLDYIHSDLWGAPSVPLSLGKCQYFISFIDDYTRKTWVYFLKHKDEAYDTFVEWSIMIENQTERKVKILRTDNGLEFYNTRFNDLYGLKQAPRMWNEKFDGYMSEIGFTQSLRDSCVYIKTHKDGSKAYLLIYVDDMLVAAKEECYYRAETEAE